MILQINPVHPQPRHIARVAEVLSADGVIAYPTDTVYGLGCDIRSKKALERVRRIKKIDNKRHLSFVFADLKTISQYAQVSDNDLQDITPLPARPVYFCPEGHPLGPEDSAD